MSFIEGFFVFHWRFGFKIVVWRTNVRRWPSAGLAEIRSSRLTSSRRQRPRANFLIQVSTLFFTLMVQSFLVIFKHSYPIRNWSHGSFIKQGHCPPTPTPFTLPIWPVTTSTSRFTKNGGIIKVLVLVNV